MDKLLKTRCFTSATFKFSFLLNTFLFDLVKKRFDQNIDWTQHFKIIKFYIFKIRSLSA